MAESISEGTLKSWIKQVGDTVAADEEVATIETDKVSSYVFLFVILTEHRDVSLRLMCRSMHPLLVPLLNFWPMKRTL